MPIYFKIVNNGEYDIEDYQEWNIFVRAENLEEANNHFKNYGKHNSSIVSKNTYLLNLGDGIIEDISDDSYLRQNRNKDNAIKFEKEKITDTFNKKELDHSIFWIKTLRCEEEKHNQTCSVSLHNKKIYGFCFTCREFRITDIQDNRCHCAKCDPNGVEAMIEKFYEEDDEEKNK